MDSINYKLVVFDMAGTTVDENNIVYKTLHSTLVNAGFDCNLEDVLSICAGKEKKQAIQDVLIFKEYSVTDEILAHLFNQFKEHLDLAYSNWDIIPQNGAIDTFNALQKKGLKVVLNTGYDRSTALRILNKLNWIVGVEFNGLVTSSEVTNGRPAPDMIFFAMQAFNVTNADQVIKVGDSVVDILEGLNAGCGMSIGITTGAQTESQLITAHPHHIIHSLNEIMHLI